MRAALWAGLAATAPGPLWAQAAEKPRLNVNATLLVQMLVFCGLVWFTMRFVWPQLIRARDERSERIADGLAAAERSRELLADARESAQRIRAEARGEAQRILDAADSRADSIVREAKAAGTADGDRLKAEARQRLMAERGKAREALKHEIAGVATEVAARLLRRPVDSAAHEDVLSELADELGE
jgi:F-type H+-transporting ATPase subunit b